MVLSGSGHVGLDVLAAVKISLGQDIPVFFTDLAPYRLELAGKLGGILVSILDASYAYPNTHAVEVNGTLAHCVVEDREACAGTGACCHRIQPKRSADSLLRLPLLRKSRNTTQ